jgi:mannose-6-phosphate isomerase
MATGQGLFLLEPEYRERVWGGRRLRASDPPTGEAWIAYGASCVLNGPNQGRTLDDVLSADWLGLLGKNASPGRDSRRFPLLAKFLDCADWLSVQVHPNDEQARRMAGPDELGKTEAWYFLETDPGAKILLGTTPGTGKDELVRAIRAGRAVDVASEIPVSSGEAVLIPAGTLHALGPGLLLYEMQESSDITYRVYDWGRPETPNRRLHIDESVEVALPVGPLARAMPHVATETGTALAIASDYFRVELASIGSEPLLGDTAGRTFHILSVIRGTVEVIVGRETAQLKAFETALVAAAAGAYSIGAVDGPAMLLRAGLPD